MIEILFSELPENTLFRKQKKMIKLCSQNCLRIQLFGNNNNDRILFINDRPPPHPLFSKTRKKHYNI